MKNMTVLFYILLNILLNSIRAETTVKNDKNINWALDRIDQVNLPLNNKYETKATGQGISIFLISTGIRNSHIEFSKNSSKNLTKIKNGYNVNELKINKENELYKCNGFGTEIASLAVGTTLGPAPDADIITVNVIPCNNAFSKQLRYLRDGLEWIKENAKFHYPSILLISIQLTELDDNIINLINDIYNLDILIIMPIDRCNSIYEKLNKVIFVSSLDINDEIYIKNKITQCVDVYGPGVNLPAAIQSSDKDYTYVSGSSYAAAIVSGVMAQIKQCHPNLNNDGIIKLLKSLYSINVQDGTIKLIQSSYIDASCKTNTYDLFLEEDYDAISPIEDEYLILDEDFIIREPGMAIYPTRIPVKNTFQNSNITKNAYILISNYGTEDLKWEIEDVSLEWLEISKKNGIIKPDQMTIVIVIYKTQKIRPKYYHTFIKINSNDPKLNKIKIPIELRVFSESLLNSGSKYELKIKNETFFETRPENWEMPALPPLNKKGNKLYMEAILEFSQPIASFDESELIIKDGDLEIVKLWQDELRSKFVIQMSKFYSNDDLWQNNEYNEFCITIIENTIFNIYHKPFQNQTICTKPKTKPRSRFYGAFLTFMSNLLVTDKIKNTLILAFSEPILGFNESNIEINENAIVKNIKPVHQMMTMFFIEVELKENIINRRIGERIKLSLKNTENIKSKANGVQLDEESGAHITFYKIDKLPIIHNSLYYMY